VRAGGTGGPVAGKGIRGSTRSSEGFGAEHHLAVVDYWSALVSPNKGTYIPAVPVDGVHTSPARYGVMAPVVERAIAVDEGKR
jgi:hypothetical protein